ncbi:MAG: ABC transporter permease subunit [Planctomycetes bacterium]|nr:ABC transporter permease subunit [Planctomycetota bacterium]
MIVIIYLAYIFLPIALLVIGSFGDNWTNTILPTGMSLRWYEQLWTDPSFRRAFSMSLQVAVITCGLVTAIALPMAYALTRNLGRVATLVSRLVTSLPIAAPPVVLAFGYIIMFSTDTFPYLGTTPLLIAAHVVATLPYMFQTLVADIRHLKLDAVELAAESLGASFAHRFFDIVLPSLRHSILSGLVVVSAISIGEFQVTNLIAGFLNRTYPVVLLQAFYGATGFACASTVLLLLLAALASVCGSLTARAASRTRGGK